MLTKVALTKPAIAGGLVAALVLSGVTPTLAHTHHAFARPDKFSYIQACEAYWLARGYYPRYFGFSTCYPCANFYW